MRMIVTLVIVLLVGAHAAAAAEYEVFIDVASEQELLDLLESQQISQDSFDALVELLRQGVDLQTATRDQLYELPNLDYDDVDRLLAARDLSVLSPEQQRAIRPFLRPLYARVASGRLRLRTLYAGDLPPTALEARVALGTRWTLGGASVLTRQRLADVSYDPTRDALAAAPASATPQLPKLYLRYDSRDLSAILGSYRIGFGQRLTFDDTSRYTPHGLVADDDVLPGAASTLACKRAQGELDESPCAGAAAHAYSAPDFRWREGLFGVAVGVRAAGHLSLHGFFSSALRPVYQYELYDARACADPRRADDPACAAPAVYERGDDPLAPAGRFAYSTLPEVLRETTLGGNATWYFDRRAHLGATAYGSSIAWRPGGMQLDFQESARYPRGGSFGAVGVDAALGLGATDVFVEVTRSFDGTPAQQGGGGDLGAILRTTTTLAAHELETALRYYGPGFANPYARPIAEPDQSNGQRGRDEAGLRLKYSGRLFAPLSLRTTADAWTAPSAPHTLHARLDTRVDWAVTPLLGVGALLAWQAGGHLRTALHVQLAATPGFALDAQVALARGAQDHSAWLLATWSATDRLRVRARARYRHEGLASSLATYAELTYRWSDAWRTRVRYDVHAFVDARAETMLRSPNPEQWMWLELEAGF